MGRGVVAVFALMFLVVSCLVVVKPARSSVDGSVENSWVSKSSMRVARSGLGVAVVNGKIYAIGGRSENGVLNTNEEYDPATDTWNFKKPMPTPRHGFTIATYKNKIYCIGGFTSDGVTGVNEVYDPVDDMWETKTPLPTVRAGLKANVVQGKIYLIGGYVGDVSSGYYFLNINEVYDPETDSWSTKAEMPTAVSSVASAVVDGKIYVIMQYRNQIYDAVNNTWGLGAPLPYSSIGVARAEATSGVNAPKRIYVFGGGKTQVYDPEADDWRFGADGPTDRYDFSVAVANDLFYVIGGSTATYREFPETWMYPPEVVWHAANEQYTPFGYGIPDPSYDGVPPEIKVVSIANKTYYTADTGLNFTHVTLDFTADEPVFSVRYVVDGGVPVEVSGNTTIAELPVGAHNVKVFGFDASGNMGTSETVFFTIAEPEPFPVAPVAAASVATVAVVGVGLLVYFRRRNHRAEGLSRNLD